MRINWMNCFALILTLIPSAVFGFEPIFKFLAMLGLTIAMLGMPALVLVIYLIFSILSSCVIYIKYAYHTYFNIEVGVALLTSSLHEKVSFLNQINYAWLAFYLAYISAVIYVILGLRKDIFNRISSRIRIMLLIVCMISLNVTWYQLDSPRHFRDYFKGVQPFSWMLTFKHLATVWQPHKEFNLDDFDSALSVSKQRNPSNAAQTYVLIIGESVRRDRLELYNDNYDTNPLLKTYPLIVYSDAISTHPHTAYSVLSMITKQPRLEEGQLKSASSFMQIFRHAGFKTFWLSNQAVIGKYDSPFSVYAFKNDKNIFASYDLSAGTAHDEILLPEIENMLNDPAPQKLIVVHLYGSHPDFEDRYPESFDRNKDAYSNTILYNDYIVAEIINMVDKQKNMAGIIYTSDHGLHFKECGDTPYHYDSAYNFQVPFVVWLSPTWKNHYAEKAVSVANNSDKKITTRYVFDSMLGMADIIYPGYQSKDDIFNGHFEERTRWVKNYSRWVDYDEAVLKGPCAVASGG